MAERIEIDSGIHFGKPCVAGTRIPVVDVLELIQQGLSFQQIREGCFPELHEEDIRACVCFAIEVLRAEDLHISVSQ